MLRVFRWWNVSVPRSWHRLAENVADSVGAFVEGTVYFIGPLLILLALGIASLLTFTWCTVLVPMWLDKYRSDDINSTTEPSQELVTTGRLVSFFPLKLGMAWGVGLHAMVVLTLLGNVMFNYWHCVRTKHVGPEYDAVVRELAAATSFPFPETPEQVMAFKRDFEDLMVLRMRRRRERAMEQQNKQEMQQQQQQETLSTTVAVPLGNGSVQHRRPADSSSASGNSGAFAALLPSPPPHDAQSLMANYPSSQLLQQQLPSVIPAVTATQAPTAAQAPVVRRWMLLGPYEWGYCGNSRQPKPPRSHYDHVSRNLVLNLDHYCPWMFNSIGYFNYRYFVCFLFYVFLSMAYGGLVSYEPFMLLGSLEYKRQYSMHRQQQHHFQPSSTLFWNRAVSSVPVRLRPMLPFAHERMLITLSFMMCLALGCAVLLLGGFHLYLVSTAQTTIEFHANWTNRRRDPKWRNPYSQGSWRKNMEQVFGTSSMWKALLPRTGPPRHLPVPLPGQDNRRKHLQEQIAKETSYQQQQKQQRCRDDSAWIV